VGLGTIGSQELDLWRRAGHPTVGHDLSEAALARVRAGSPEVSGDHALTSDFGELSSCGVLVLCLPNLSPSLELSMDAFDSFAASLQGLEEAGRLIVLASTLPIGFSRTFAARLGAHGRLVAHAPERFDPGRGTELGEIPRVVGGISDAARELAVALYRGAGVTVHEADPIEVAEASKLLENSFRLVNIAFVNEFAELCRRLGITAADVIGAAATKPFAFMAHQPGVGAGGTCIPTMPRYLLQAAAGTGLRMPILEDSVAGNDSLSDRVAEHLATLMPAAEATRSRVLVVGATYKPDYADVRASAAIRFARGLARHHSVTVFDPIASPEAVGDGFTFVNEIPESGFDAVVVAVRHRDLDIAALRRLSPVFFDLVRGSVEVSQASPTHT
jgi:UDP-N-acetyl-D-glucosamine dehydrogenase